jgi:glycosyltransferase involved in cell wall biosynthesis
MQPEKPVPPPARPLQVVYLTAGAAGMICGSCIHDNTLARAMIRLGHDVQLIPLYTPIRTDEEDVSADAVFFGGINMYLQQKASLFRRLPMWLDRWLDHPRLIQWASGRSVKIDPQQVADLTLSILRGTAGFQRKEVERLAGWLAAGPRPEVVVLSNILTAGCVPEIKRRLDLPVVVTLQGDDIFLRGLPKEHEAEALNLIGRLAQSVDRFIVNSRYYAEAMSQYLGLDRERVAMVPLGIDTSDFEPESAPREERAANRPPTVGYMARLAPEKGLHVLGEAFLRLRTLPGMESARLLIGGWMGEKNRRYAEEVFAKLRSAAGDAFTYLGEVNRAQKLKLLRSIDVLAVPTTYQEPKGLFVLEALAAGVPVVAPDHGALPEMLAETGGGLLHRPGDAEHLAQRLHELLADREKAQQLGETAQRQVLARRNARVMAERTLDVLRSTIGYSV